jgi:hypothetical protein
MRGQQEVARRVKERIRRGLAKSGTNLQLNDSDPFGDGDQSEIQSPSKQQFYREIFSEGGDITECFGAGMVSQFAVFCLLGNVPLVMQALEAADKNQANPPDSLVQLLERRETSMRLSPLLLIVSAGKNVGEPLSSSPDLRENQIKVA